MRILSTGDWHFNAGYDDDVLSSVRQIIEYVYSHNVDLVAITGDVYERASDPNSRNLAADCIQQLAAFSPVLIVRGNHDAPGDLAILSKLDSIRGITVDEVARQHPEYGGQKGVCITTLPWVTKSRWMSSNPEAGKEQGDTTVSQMVLQYIRNVVALDPSLKHVVVGHLTIAGARAQNHQQLGADGVTLGLYDLHEAGVYAALLGHIHLKQQLGPSALHVYNGSIAALDYGESPDKYFSVINTDTNSIEWIKLNTTHRQDVDAEWTPNGLKIHLEGITQRQLKGARVRANLRINGGDNAEVAKDQLEAWLKSIECLEYKVNPQVINATQVRSAEISKAESLGEKLDQYWKAVNSDLPDNVKADMKDKLADLEEACYP